MQAAEQLARDHQAHAYRDNPADSNLLQVDHAMKSVTIKREGLKAAAIFLYGAHWPHLYLL